MALHTHNAPIATYELSATERDQVGAELKVIYDRLLKNVREAGIISNDGNLDDLQRLLSAGIEESNSELIALFLKVKNIIPQILNTYDATARIMRKHHVQFS